MVLTLTLTLTDSCGCDVYRKPLSMRIGRLKASLSDLSTQRHRYDSAVLYFESLVSRAANCADDDDDSCIICFELMTDLTVTPCQHYFCNSCISTCLKANGLCPTCRRSVRLDELVKVEVSLSLQLVIIIIIIF